MISSWADCFTKWVRAGKLVVDSLNAADAWEAAHQEIDRREQQAMHEYQAGVVLKASQSIKDVNRSALADGCIAEQANSLLPTSTSKAEDA